MITVTADHEHEPRTSKARPPSLRFSGIKQVNKFTGNIHVTSISHEKVDKHGINTQLDPHYSVVSLMGLLQSVRIVCPD